MIIDCHRILGMTLAHPKYHGKWCCQEVLWSSATAHSLVPWSYVDSYCRNERPKFGLKWPKIDLDSKWKLCLNSEWLYNLILKLKLKVYLKVISPQRIFLCGVLLNNTKYQTVLQNEWENEASILLGWWIPVLIQIKNDNLDDKRHFQRLSSSEHSLVLSKPTTDGPFALRASCKSRLHYTANTYESARLTVSFSCARTSQRNTSLCDLYHVVTSISSHLR